MGLCASGGPREQTASERAAADLDKQLYIEELKMLYNFKILVLGAGESGKSTVVKQLRFIHKAGGMNERELKRIRETLAENTMDCFKSMIEACATFNIDLDDDDDKKFAELLLDEEQDKIEYTVEVAASLRKLWESKALKDVFQMRDKFWLLDSVEYYCTNIEKFADEAFVPAEEDIVMARVRTTGIVTTEFDQRNVDSTEEWDKNIHYQVIDVGGQRAERKKWMHCFDDVKAILFVVNMAGYNMVLFEDDTKNRMHEALELFQDTVNKDIFKDTPVFLFLNKKDLFEEKIKKQGLECCFPEYSGAQNTQESLAFISSRFKEKMPAQNVSQFRDFYIASRVKRDVKNAFEDLQSGLLRMNQTKIETETKRICKEARFTPQ